jgi:hypothetical protein
MTMKKTVSVYDFRDAFQQIRPNNFSYEGLTILFDYFEQLEEDCGQEIELDVIAICCDYSEDTPLSIAENYGIEIDPNENDEEIMQQVKDFLETETIMVGSTDAGTIVYANF